MTPDNDTIVRPSWFAQNLSEDLLVEPVRRGVPALPAVGVPEPFVDAEDIADGVWSPGESR